MSEDLMQGTIQGITQKKADTWMVQLLPQGSQYPKNLWTKDAELVESLAAKIGQEGAFVGAFGAPYTVNGSEVRSWWINGTAEGEQDAPQSTRSVATPVAAPRVYTPDTKDRMIVRQTALKAAAEIVAPRAGTFIDPDWDAALEVMKAAARFETWVYRDIGVPEDSVPF